MICYAVRYITHWTDWQNLKWRKVLIQLIDENDVRKRNTREIKSDIYTPNVQLIEPDEVIGKAPEINIKEKKIVKENALKNKKYHLLRWKIKRFLIQENIIKKCINWETILDVFDPEILNKDNLTDIEIKQIFKLYSCKLIEHHTKYKEIHGIDESLWMTPSEHRNLHNRLRREGKCDIPPNELAKISLMASKRSQKGVQRRKEYIGEWRKTDKGGKYTRSQNRNFIAFWETLAKNARMYETIYYHDNTGHLNVYSGFQYGRGKGFPTVQID